jgi:hypothetical protein
VSERRQIEYYLADKWGLLSSLTWPCRVVQPRLPYFNPKVVLYPTQSGPISVWLDAADPSTITLVSGRVSQWADKARYNGVSWTLFQNTSGIRPTYANNGVVFSAASNTYLTSVTTGSGQIGSTTSVFMVVTNCISGTAGSSTVLFGAGTNPPTSTSFSVSVGSSTTQTVSSIGGSSAVSLPGTFLLAARINATTRSLRLNGAVVSTAAGGTVTITAGHVLTMGAVGSAYLNGSINEVIVFLGSLNTGMTQIVEGYLAWKWGLAHRLPTTHPYYKYAAGP